MQIANVRLRLNKNGSDIPVFGCTPAEAVLLHVLHSPNNGGSTFGDEMNKIEILNAPAQTITGKTEEKVIEAVEAQPQVGLPGQSEFKPAIAAKAKEVIPAKEITRDRTDSEELRRLRGKYGRCVTKKGDSIIGKIWPGLDSKLPAKFSDIDYSKLSFDGMEVASLDLASGKPVTT